MVRGFTLLEMLAVLAILAILLVLAIPSDGHFFSQSQTTVQLNMLIDELHFSRNEAISRNEKLIFCKSVDGEKCGGAWRDGQVLLDPNGKVLRVFSALPRKDNLVWNSSGGLNDFIAWSPSGYTNGQRGTFYYCTESNVLNPQGVVLSDTGRPYISSVSREEYAKYCR